MVSKVWEYERSDLSERQKVALRLADAYVIGMGRVPAPLAAAAAAHLSPAELIEIGVLLFKSAQNKIRIALNTDAPAVSIYVVPPPD
jgi:alkylhydroperoxidase family enzyme